MNDLATLAGTPQKLRINGKEYSIHPLTLADLGELQAWVDDQFPDPLAVVAKACKSGNFNVTQQQYMISKAIEQASRSRHLIGSFEADELLLTAEGYKKVLVVSIRKGDPSFTDEDAADLFRHMTTADVAKLESATTLNLVVSDPKEPPLNIVPPENGNGSATSRKARSRKRRGTGGNSSTTR